MNLFEHFYGISVDKDDNVYCKKSYYDFNGERLKTFFNSLGPNFLKYPTIRLKPIGLFNGITQSDGRLFEFTAGNPPSFFKMLKRVLLKLFATINETIDYDNLTFYECRIELFAKTVDHVHFLWDLGGPQLGLLGKHIYLSFAPKLMSIYMIDID